MIMMLDDDDDDDDEDEDHPRCSGWQTENTSHIIFNVFCHLLLISFVCCTLLNLQRESESWLERQQIWDFLMFVALGEHNWKAGRLRKW